MNTTLWIAQALLAFALFGAGTMKLTTPHAALAAQLPWAGGFSGQQVKLIGVAELLGAVGLVVPWATGIAPALTPLAAAGVLALMLGAVRVHIARRESFVPPAILGALALLVALGRSGALG
jgi:hypothetical protein